MFIIEFTFFYHIVSSSFSLHYNILLQQCLHGGARQRPGRDDHALPE